MPPNPKPGTPGSCGTETNDEGESYNPHDGNWTDD